MPVIKIKFGDEADKLSHHFRRMVDDFFQVGFSTGPLAKGWQPPVNVCEDNKYLYIMADMAGVQKEEISVTVEGNFVRIKGKRAFPLGPGSRRFHYMEVLDGDGERIVKIPCDVSAEGSMAQFENGLLVVKIPKKTGGQGVKIEVEQ